MIDFGPSIMDNTENREVVRLIKDQLKNCDEAKFAIGYFFITGFSLIEDDFPAEFKKKPFLKIVMGDETTKQTGEEIKEGYELRDLFMDKMIGELEGEKITEEQIRNITLLRKLIAEEVIEIKLFDKSKLHAKLYLFLTNPTSEYQSPGLALVGSSNFTKQGLTKNKELNVALTSREDVLYLNKWFDDLWEEATDFSQDMLKIIDYSGVTEKDHKPTGLTGKDHKPRIGQRIDPELLFKYLVYHWFDGRVKNILKKDVLMEFQLIGVMNAINSLNTYNGVILADSVGLGKSFLAGAVIEEYINGKHPTWKPENKKPSALLILPPSLINQWEDLLINQEYFFQGQEKRLITSNNELTSAYEIIENETLGKIGFMSLGKFQNLKKESLKSIADEYDIYVIDEAHKYRNSNTKRWKNTRKLQRKTTGEKNKFLLLTATPINNSIRDVYNLIRLFMDDTLMQFRLKGVEVDELINQYTRLKKEIETDPDPHKKKELKKIANKIKKEILDEIMVLRTRKYILEQSKDLQINGKPLIFKDPQPFSLEYSAFYKKEYLEFIELLKETLPELNFEHTKLYGSRYILFEDDEIGGKEPEMKLIEIADLLKLLLGKRLESGIYPFETTLRRIYEKEKIFYELFKNKKTWDRTTFKRVLEAAIEKAHIKKDLDEIMDEYGLEEVTRFDRIIDIIKDYAKSETNPLKSGIEIILDLMEKDLRTMDKIFNSIDNLKEIERSEFKTLGKIPLQEEDIIEMPIFTYKDDPKLRALKSIIGNPEFKSTKINVPSLKGKKIVIFTQYKDTAYYIYNNLLYWIKNEIDLQPWLKDGNRLKIGLVTGETETSTKINYIKRFSPSSNNGWNEVKKSGDIEILITTDALSEGINLQDADAVVNYDLPWNPMIIVQRVGRVNRIGNEKDITVVNYMPSGEIEVLVGILNKLNEKIEDITLVVGKDVRILSPEEKINIETFGEKIKDLSKIPMEKLEEYGLSTEIKGFMPDKISSEQLEDYKLLNKIQYELGYTPEDFSEVEKMDGNYYTYIENDGGLTAIYEYYKGPYKLRKQILTLKDGKIKESSPFKLLELIKSKGANPYKIDKAIEGLEKFKRNANKVIEHLKRENTEQRGFLRDLCNALYTEEEASDMEKFSCVYNTIAMLPYKSYSGKIKSYLIDEGLIRVETNKIEINDINEVVNSLYDYLTDKEVLVGPSVIVESKIRGWYLGYNKNS